MHGSSQRLFLLTRTKDNETQRTVTSSGISNTRTPEQKSNWVALASGVCGTRFSLTQLGRLSQGNWLCSFMQQLQGYKYLVHIIQNICRSQFSVFCLFHWQADSGQVHCLWQGQQITGQTLLSSVPDRCHCCPTGDVPYADSESFLTHHPRQQLPIHCWFSSA